MLAYESGHQAEDSHLIFFEHIVIFGGFQDRARGVAQGLPGPAQSIPIVLGGCLECRGALWRPCGPDAEASPPSPYPPRDRQDTSGGDSKILGKP